MNLNKLDPRLEHELKACKNSDESRKLIPVIVEHNGALTGLEDFGVQNARALPLVNAFAAELTREQIKEATGKKEIKLIRYGGPEYVLTRD